MLGFDLPTMKQERIRVLVVEDDHDYWQLVHEELSEARSISLDILRVESLADAHVVLHQQQIDCVLLDLDLPDSKGLETYEGIRAHAPDVAVVVLTVTDDESLALEIVKRGAQDYLTKGESEGVLLLRCISYAVQRQRILAELQQALSKIKTLRGLIPICAACKRIRDDKGYWKMLEAYIQEHSDAEFSHSLCPECRETLFHDAARRGQGG